MLDFATTTGRVLDRSQALWIYVVDSDRRPVPGAPVRVRTAEERPIPLRREGHHLAGEVREDEEVIIESDAEGFERDEHRIRTRGPITQAVHGLRRPGELHYEQGNDRLAFEPQRDRYLIDLNGKNALERLRAAAENLELEWMPIPPPWRKGKQACPGKHSVYAEVEGPLETSADLVDAVASDGIRVSAAAIIQHGEGPPLGLTNKLAVRFRPEVRREEGERIAASVGLVAARPVNHLGNGLLLAGPSAASYDILERVEALRRSPQVVYAAPTLLFQLEPDAYTPKNDPVSARVPRLG